jgi:hypothetical protein
VTYLWNDPVWNKVIAGLFVAFILWVVPPIRTRLKAAFWAFLRPQKRDAAPVVPVTHVEPVVIVTHVVATPPDGKTRVFPLKIYATFRNDSHVMIDVRVLSYTPMFVRQKEFAEGVLTVELRQENFYPQDIGASRIAVLPGQKFKAWIGVDETTQEASKINSHPGVLGTLTLSINGKPTPFDLRRG